MKRLKRLLEEYLAKNEIKEIVLAFYPEDPRLTGSKDDLIKMLVESVNKEQRLEELLILLDNKHPHILWDDDTKSIDTMQEQSGSEDLAKLIEKYLPIKELIQIALNLDVNQGYLKGRKEQQIHLLVDVMNKDGRMDEFLEALFKHNPDIRWFGSGFTRYDYFKTRSSIVTNASRLMDITTIVPSIFKRTEKELLHSSSLRKDPIRFFRIPKTTQSK